VNAGTAGWATGTCDARVLSSEYREPSRTSFEFPVSDFECPDFPPFAAQKPLSERVGHPPSRTSFEFPVLGFECPDFPPCASQKPLSERVGHPPSSFEFPVSGFEKRVLKRVLTAVVLVPIVLLIVFHAPIWLFAIVVGLIALQTTREYLDIVEKYQLRPFRTTVYVFLVLSFALAIWIDRFDPYRPPLKDLSYFALVVGTAVLVVLSVGMGRDDLRSCLTAAAASFLALVYIVLPLFALVSIRDQDIGWFAILVLLVIVWLGDIAAFFVGRSLGRHKLAPRVSPNKTWEGAVASIISAITAALLLYRFYPQIATALASAHLIDASGGQPLPAKLWQVVLLAAIVNAAAQLGDLVESMMKRGAGVKDSGSILPGHGGMLDRIDALLFAAPVMWYYTLIAGGIGR
jgi:phosphatidate cytidylyltransferase